MPTLPEKVQAKHVYRNTKKAERVGFAQPFSTLSTVFAHVVSNLSTDS